MAAYAQFGYGSYPSATQLLSANVVTQSPQTAGADTPTVQSTISSSSGNAPALSPAAECRTNAAASTDISSSALSPDDMSQNSNTTAVAAQAAGLSLNNISGGSSQLDHPGVAGVAAVGGVASSGNSCCENGRPIMTDPVSGQTVCSCQYDSARLALSSYTRLPAASVGVYGTPYPSTDQNPYPSIGVDSSAFYSPLSNPYALKDSTAGGTDMSAWTSAGLQPTTGYYAYDPMSAYGYGTSYDLAARRKNATRESTATLKAWLNEHKKNPYPTKGEKIMLAIITKMTLTQVSTWFANARRRLKKENKMTWEPKNRTDDDDDVLASDDEKEKDDMMEHREKMTQSGAGGGGGGAGGMHNPSIGMGGTSALGDNRKTLEKDEDDLTDEEQKPLNRAHDMRCGTIGFPGSGYHGASAGSAMSSSMTSNHPHGYHPYHHQHPAYYQHQQAMAAANYHANNNNNINNINNNNDNHKNESNNPKNQLGRDCGVPIPATKPKIWSLADTVACKTPPPITGLYMGQQHQQQQHLQHQQQQPAHQQQHSMQHHQQLHQHQQQHMNASHNHLQQQQPTQSMQPVEQAMSNFGAMPYSRAHTTAYRGFLGVTMQQQQQQPPPPQPQQLPTTNNIPYTTNNNNNNNHNRMHNTNNHNHSNTNNNSNNNINGTHTSIIPITTPASATNHLGQQQQPQHLHAANQRAMGFPEAQPDTPPQTPPNMKLPPNVVANLLLTASQVPTTGICRSNNGPPPPSSSSSLSSSSSSSPLSSYRMNQISSSALYNNNGYSPRDECSSSGSSSRSSSSCGSSNAGSPKLNSNEATFKPFMLKNQQRSIAGFVSSG